MPTKTHWTNWEIETVHTICTAGAAGFDLQKLRDAVPLPQNRGWATFDSALTQLADKLQKVGLALTFNDGRAALSPVDHFKAAA